MIYRREEQGNFYCRREVAGKDITKSLDTPIRTIAIQNAKAWLDEIVTAATTQKWDRLDTVRSRSALPTIGTILERYEERAAAAGHIDPKSVSGNASALRTMLTLATGSDPANQRADILNEATVRKFVERARAAGRSESGTSSTLTQARSVFARHLLYIYDGIRLPDLAGFRTTIKFERANDVGFRPFPPEVEQAMETAAVALKQADPAVWLIYMLMSRLGLRNIECERITSSALRFDHDSETWHLHIPRTKDGLPRMLALPDDLTAETITRIAGSPTDPAAPIIPAANKTERRNLCQRDINRFVRRFLPDRDKGAYELRKWAGSLVWSTQGDTAAQSFLGHTDIQTTQRYYARFLRPVRAVSAADRASIHLPAQNNLKNVVDDNRPMCERMRIGGNHASGKPKKEKRK
jgi:integrase